MFHGIPSTARLSLRLVCCLLTSAAMMVRAQNYSTDVNDLVGNEKDQSSVLDLEKKHSEGWDLSAVISAAYNSNIFLSAEDPQSDVVFRVAPTVAYSKGDANDGEGAYIKAGYRPTGVVYIENGSSNRVDQQAILSAGWRGKMTRLTYAGVIQKLGDVVPDTGLPTDRLEFSNEVRAAWIPREKLALEIGAGNSQTIYQDPQYFNNSVTFGELGLRYTYSPKTELGLIYQIGRTTGDGTTPQDTQQLTGAVSWRASEKFGVNLEAGAEHRKADGGASVNPVMRGRIDWTPRQGTAINLTGYMFQQASAYYAGQNIQVNGMTAGITQRIIGNWSMKLDAGYESNTYETVSGNNIIGRV
ncbi:MAG: hypothetical protein H8M99_07950, partial [Gloeobacteraceae cyanobacterium ES-bin-144]|nr:hypothetical protein [Verrucomicrobiales bacterium]